MVGNLLRPKSHWGSILKEKRAMRDKKVPVERESNFFQDLLITYFRLKTKSLTLFLSLPFSLALFFAYRSQCFFQSAGSRSFRAKEPHVVHLC